MNAFEKQSGMSQHGPIQKKRVIDQRMGLILGAQLFAILFLSMMSYYSGRGGSGSIADYAELLNTAGRLQSIGVINESISYYEEYLDKTGKFLENEAKAKLSFMVAELYEKSGEYEKALGKYYLVEIYDSSSLYKSEAQKQIVSILEKLKKFSAVKTTLAESTMLNSGQTGNDSQKGEVSRGKGIVLAKIGERSIYLSEVDELIDILPPPMRESINKGESKVEFVKNYIASLLIYEKAIRLRMNEDSKFRKELAQIERDLLIKKYFDEETLKRVTLNESDLKNYYLANKTNFQTPTSIKVALFKSSDKAEASPAKLESNSKKWKDFDSEISVDRPFMDDLETTKKLIEGEEGKVIGPFEIKGEFYLIKIKKRNVGKELPYEEVKTKIVQNYKDEKAKEVYKSLLEESLKASDVKLFLEKVK